MKAKKYCIAFGCLKEHNPDVVKLIDETQWNMVHAAKCLNTKCDNPVNVPWKNDQVVIRPKPKVNDNTVANGHNDISKENDKKITKYDQDTVNNGSTENSHKIEDTCNFESSSQALEVNGIKIEKEINEDEIVDDVIHCNKCGTKYTDMQLEKYKKAMDFTELHLQDMKGASVAYVDVCKYCMELQEGVLHPLNVTRAQTLDHAFDAFIQVELWDSACQYAEQLLKCFRYYYGERHPLFGLLHLKYGKILLYKMDVQKALEHLKCSEKILKITHGDRHPLYKKQLLPVLRQAVIESSH